MKKTRRFIAAYVVLMGLFAIASASSAIAQEESNPVKAKFQQDLKDAVMSESITVPQLKEIQANLETLKASKSQPPGSPVDLMTPYIAVSQIRATMATVKEPARTTLRQDFQLMMATKQPPPSTEPDSPGKKLGKDIFTAVMRGQPTPAQVETLQQSLNTLGGLKSSNEGGLQKLRAMKGAKSSIEQAMQGGGFRPEDTQTVLADLNNLGGGGRGRGGF